MEKSEWLTVGISGALLLAAEGDCESTFSEGRLSAALEGVGFGGGRLQRPY
jgi:hypothetical protein